MSTKRLQGVRARQMFSALNQNITPGHSKSKMSRKRSQGVRARQIFSALNQNITPGHSKCNQTQCNEASSDIEATVPVKRKKSDMKVEESSHDENNLVFDMPVSPLPVLLKVKSLSLSNLTEDTAKFSLKKKCSSTLHLQYEKHTKGFDNDDWIWFYSNSEQYPVKQNYWEPVISSQTGVMLTQKSSVITSNNDITNVGDDKIVSLSRPGSQIYKIVSEENNNVCKARSLSLSDLTQDVIFPRVSRRCKSASTENECNNIVSYKDIPQPQEQSDTTNDVFDESISLSGPGSQISKIVSEENHNVCKARSLSLSDLTQDVIFPRVIRRCKSFSTENECNNIVSYKDIPQQEQSDKTNDVFDESITDCETSKEDEVYYGDLDEGRKRRRKAKPGEWSRNKAKASRMNGEEYIGYRKPRGERAVQDILRPARQMRETCDSDFCKKSKLRGCARFTEETRKKIHSKFWKTLNWDQRKIFVTSLVTRSTPNRQVVKNNSRRQGTLQYFLPLTSKADQKVQVCREMFLNTLSLGSFTVQSWVKKAEYGMSSHQDLLNLSRIVTPNEETIQKNLTLETFLNKIPKLPSHYARKETSKLYIEPTYKSLADVYNTYKEYCITENKKPVCRRSFENRFHDKNLSLLTLKKDMCDTCSSYLAGNLNEADYQMHIIKKNRAQKEKTDDKKKADKQEFILLTMDLESVKVCPYLKASALYFKTKLTCHNFTVYNLTNHHCTCYWFNETTANLMASTFASFIVDYLERHCLPLRLPIIIFSDGCTYQNRNTVLANALLNLSKRHGVTIIQKFLIPGHTQMECDSAHSVIERKLKNREIHLPSDYSTVTKEARKGNPYEVMTISHGFTKDFADPKNWIYKSIRPGRKVGDPQVVDVRAIKYSPDLKIKVKLDFDEEWFDLPQRQQVLNHEVTYQSMFADPIPITLTKYEHLQQLKSVIPKDCHSFYDNLPKN